MSPPIKMVPDSDSPEMLSRPSLLAKGTLLDELSHLEVDTVAIESKLLST